MNKAALFYVEQTVTVHTCFVLRVSTTVSTVSCSLVVAFQYFLCFEHGEGQQASKKENKNK